MASIRLLQVACAVALLATAPAFAQSSAPGGTSGATTPGDMRAAPSGHAMHKSAMAHHKMHGAQGASAQDSAVDRLNDQSYQAAQQGQAFTGPADGSAAPSSGAGMPGGSMHNGKM